MGKWAGNNCQLKGAIIAFTLVYQRAGKTNHGLTSRHSQQLAPL
jgi:hypothetical protein